MDEGDRGQEEGQGHEHLAALARHRGQATEPRQHGVYHDHRRQGWHPHPHGYTARRLLAARPRDDPAAVSGAAPSTSAVVVSPPAPLHHYQHRGSERHMPAPRRTVPELERAQVTSYDAESGTALVQLVGSPTRVVGPVPVSSALRDATLVGMACLVVLLDRYNPADGVVVAAWTVASG